MNAASWCRPLRTGHNALFRNWFASRQEMKTFTGFTK
jgi:hypothetical protein